MVRQSRQVQERLIVDRLGGLGGVRLVLEWLNSAVKAKQGTDWKGVDWQF